MSTPMSPRRARTSFSPSAFLAAALLVAPMACGSSQSPVAPVGMNLWLTDAQIQVAGAVVNGMTIMQGQMVARGTLFQATLRGPSGPAPGQVVQVRYRLPRGPGMMLDEGLLTLFDDGTRGDPTPGDGIYCFEDIEGRFGFHMPHAPFGQYHYEFFGIHGGEHTNHVEVVVTIAQQ